MDGQWQLLHRSLHCFPGYHQKAPVSGNGKVSFTFCFCRGTRTQRLSTSQLGTHNRRHCDAETPGTQVYKSAEGRPGSWCTVL